ncbi:MAG: hypothetical protein WC472_01035 [Candidatus Paceibacterota bacterium]
MIVFLIPLFYAFANLADKILVTGDDDDADPGALLALSGLFSGLFSIIFGFWIYFTGRSFGDIPTIVMLIGIGAIYYSAIWIYLDMLKANDSSSVTAWFQIIPLFGTIGAFIILREIPVWYQIVAIPMLIIGGFMLSYRKGGFNKTIVFWMIISAALVALYDVLFAEYGRSIDEFSAIFFMLLGKTASGFVVLVADKKSQRGFWIALTTKLKTQLIAESANTLADVVQYACILSMPILLVQGAGTLQPMCVLAGAIVLGNRYPKLKEDIKGINLYQKVLGIVLMIAGGIFLM